MTSITTISKSRLIVQHKEARRIRTAKPKTTTAYL